MGLLIILFSIVSIYRLKMIGHCILALFPAFVLSKSVVSGDITEIQICQYFDARIQRFEEKVKEMKAYVDVDSEFYRILEASKLCDTVGRVAVPECAGNREGDDCAAAKIESIKKPLLRAIKVDKSGKEFFDYCKYIGYKNVLKTFIQTRKLMSGECGLTGQKLSGDREPRNELVLPLLVAGAYDPSSICFQYFLCKDQQIYCYFFTQGWNQYEYGQYYLYENLLDDTNGIFAGSTDSSNLATLALLGGLGGGSPYSGHYPAPSGYTGRKRRASDEADVCLHNSNADGCPKRKRRDAKCDENPNASECPSRKRRDARCDENLNAPGCPDRKRRDARCDENPNALGCPDRKRRDVRCDENPNDPGCPDRRRRDARCDENPTAFGCPDRKRRDARCDENPTAAGCPDRKRRDACDACEKNSDSEDCKNCY